MDALALVNMTRDYLLAGRPHALNELGADVDGADARKVTLTLAHADPGLATGQTVNVGWEDFYVWTFDRETLAAECRPALGGSPREAHSDGDLVLVNVRWSNWQLLQELQRAVDRVSQDLFEALECEFIWDGTREQWDLPFPRPVRRVVEVRAETARAWEWWALNPQDYRLVANAPPTDDYPSGQALSIYSFPLVTPGRKVRVVGAADLRQFTEVSTDVATDTGLADSALDVLALAAAENVAVMEEGRRNQLDMQGDTRRGAEVPMTAWTAQARELRRRYQERLGEERARLTNLYPYRSH